MIDGIPLRENAVTAKILEALTKAVEVIKGILLRLEEGHAQSSPLVNPKRGGYNFVQNYCRSQGTQDSDHIGSRLQGNYA